MPQIAVETYFTQFFWLFIILFIFNDFILHKYIPGIAKLLKARKETSTYSSKKLVSSNINIELPLFSSNIKGVVKNFNDTKVNWIKKQKKL